MNIWDSRSHKKLLHAVMSGRINAILKLRSTSICILTKSRMFISAQHEIILTSSSKMKIVSKYLIPLPLSFNSRKGRCCKLNGGNQHQTVRNNKSIYWFPSKVYFFLDFFSCELYLSLLNFWTSNTVRLYWKVVGGRVINSKIQF